MASFLANRADRNLAFALLVRSLLDTNVIPKRLLTSRWCLRKFVAVIDHQTLVTGKEIIVRFTLYFQQVGN